MNLTDRIVTLIIEEARERGIHTSDDAAAKFFLEVTGDLHQRAVTTARKHAPWHLRHPSISPSPQKDAITSFAQEPPLSTARPSSSGWISMMMASFSKIKSSLIR